LPCWAAWWRRRGISPSKVLIPLSVTTITGGTLTLVGSELLSNGAAVLLQGPGHRGRQPHLEAVARLPALLRADPAGIDRIAPIVAGAVGDRGDQLAVVDASRQQSIEGTADRLHHLFVGALTGCSI
jgi:hypothetical protein